MCDVHFNVFIYNFIECAFRHFLDMRKSPVEIQRRSEGKTALCDIYRPYLPCKIIEPSENVSVDLLESLRRPYFNIIDEAAFKKLICLLLAFSSRDVSIFFIHRANTSDFLLGISAMIVFSPDSSTTSVL